MNAYNLEMHIEELVLHGFDPRDCYTIGEAVQSELTRLFTEQEVRPSLVQDHKLVKLDGGVFHMKQGAKADALGVQIAQSVYGGLGK